jgi:hypothetical protein
LRIAAAAFLASIGILEFAIYFHDLHHYFQGDTVFWLYYRAHSITDFFHWFSALDAGGWYRPIGNLLLPSLLFPWLGLQPEGYRIVVFVLFFANTIAVFALMWRLTRNAVVTGVAVGFFATQTVHTITTYDVAFAPELLYSLFYICSVVTFLRFLETGRKQNLSASVVFFLTSLFSKESAFTLPAMLLVAAFLTRSEVSLRKTANAAIRGVRWHLALLLVYLMFTVGYLHVGGVSLAKLMEPPRSNGQPSYDLILGPSLLRNLDYATTWAFNLPRLSITESRGLKGWSLGFLKAFRLGIATLGIAVLAYGRRKWILLGLAWFVIASFPALLLRDHLMPYYLFLPVAGFSLVIGAALEWLYESVRRFSVVGADIACFLPLAIMSLVCASSIWNEAAGSPLLGVSSALARTSVSDLRMILPSMHPNTLIYIIDDLQPDLAFAQASGGLIKLDRDEERLEFRYSSAGAKIDPKERHSVIVVRCDGVRLENVTGAFRNAPFQFANYIR